MTKKIQTILSEIVFYSGSKIKIYEIDSTYIGKLLETYSANNKNIRAEIVKALQKLEKSDIVKQVYRGILNAIDNKKVDLDADIFSIKREFFTAAEDQAIIEFATNWFANEDELRVFALQYTVGKDPFLTFLESLTVEAMISIKL